MSDPLKELDGSLRGAAASAGPMDDFATIHAMALRVERNPMFRLGISTGKIPVGPNQTAGEVAARMSWDAFIKKAGRDPVPPKDWSGDTMKRITPSTHSPAKALGHAVKPGRAADVLKAMEQDIPGTVSAAFKMGIHGLGRGRPVYLPAYALGILFGPGYAESDDAKNGP